MLVLKDGIKLFSCHATLVSCTESIDESPSGILLHGIMSAIAEFYSRNLANEVMKGLVHKAKNGTWLSVFQTALQVTFLSLSH
jgi:DNA invertase Pin-like site-specific DNA recombinase